MVIEVFRQGDNSPDEEYLFRELFLDLDKSSLFQL